jgi:hypothetical protein
MHERKSRVALRINVCVLFLTMHESMVDYSFAETPLIIL